LAGRVHTADAAPHEVLEVLLHLFLVGVGLQVVDYADYVQVVRGFSRLVHLGILANVREIQLQVRIRRLRYFHFHFFLVDYYYQQ
jgi:hypothetical protein